MRKVIHAAHWTNREIRERRLLLPVVRSLWQSNAQKDEPDGGVLHLWETVQQAPRRDQEECRRQAFLLAKLLVLVQSTRQPLFVGGRSRRQDECRRESMAQSRCAARSRTLPYLLRYGSRRSAPYPLVHQVSRNPVGDHQRHHALPSLPRSDSPPTGATPRRCLTAQDHGRDTAGGVA
jgi:hypothetical protein